MKRKIIAACLIACMLLVAVTSATLAYFTDQDALKNEFTVGDISIDLYEIVDYELGQDPNSPDQTTALPVYVGKGTDKAKDSKHGYTNLLPSDEITKEVHITNTSNNSAYVRVTVVMNHVDAIDKAIDQTYEAKGYTEAQIQEIYNEVFNGWGINHTKRESGTTRMWMTERNMSPVLFGGQIDTVAKYSADYTRVDMNNTFMTDDERAKFEKPGQHDGILNTTQGDPAGYYAEAVGVDERAYVFYLYLKGGEDYKLFDGLKVPAEFDEKQAKMFEGLKIDVYADAIQAAGFNGSDANRDAFDALNEIYPIGHWNAK